MSVVPSVFPCFCVSFRHTSEFYRKRLPGGARQNLRSGFFLVYLIAVAAKTGKVVSTSVLTKPFLSTKHPNFTMFIYYIKQSQDALVLIAPI